MGLSAVIRQMVVTWAVTCVVRVSSVNGQTPAEIYRTDHLDAGEKRLYQNITSGYNAMSRPVRNASEPIRLTFGVTLKQILDLDEKHQVLSAYLWISEEWRDENIGWRPEDFEDLDRLMFPATRLWVPDIYIFNVAGSALDGYINVSGIYVVVSHDGHVQWTVPILVETTCPIDATYFPYDKQSCEILFGSWIHDMSQIDIDIESTVPDLSQYVVNNEFDIDRTSLERVVDDGSCCPGKGAHPIVRMRLYLRRKTIYYDYIVIAPTINLCILTLATFLLPGECGWKVAIGLTVFLTLYVLQLLIAENVPDTNSTPLIGVFLLLVMSLNCVSLIMATLVMNIKRRGQYETIPRVSALLLYVCEHYLSRITCTNITDWKRMAVDVVTDTESNIPADSDQDHQNTFAHNVCVDKRDRPTTQYMQLRDLSPASCNMSERCLQRNFTAESSFSGASIGDRFLDEVSCTDRLLGEINSSKGCTLVHEYPCKQAAASNVNMSFSPGVEHNVNDMFTASQQVNHQDAASSDALDHTWNTHHRKRASYRRAISTGRFIDDEVTGPEHQPLAKTRSELSNLTMKYQWFFVADVIDTLAFIVYIILMFVGILTVLVIVPLYA